MENVDLIQIARARWVNNLNIKHFLFFTLRNRHFILLDTQNSIRFGELHDSSCVDLK